MRDTRVLHYRQHIDAAAEIVAEIGDGGPIDMHERIELARAHQLLSAARKALSYEEMT